MVTPCTVLVVDDNDPVRDYVHEVLESVGLTVLDAAHPAAALTIAARNPAGLGLLVTDVEMPGIDGPELARRVQDISPGTPVVYISGLSEWELEDRGILDGPTMVLAKPFGPDALIDRVRAALNGTVDPPEAAPTCQASNVA